MLSIFHKPLGHLCFFFGKNVHFSVGFFLILSPMSYLYMLNIIPLPVMSGFLGDSVVKNLPAMQDSQEMQV